MRNIAIICVILTEIFICLSSVINKEVLIDDSTDINKRNDIDEISNKYNSSVVEKVKDENKIFLNSRKRNDNTESELYSESYSESNSESDSESYINIDGIQNIKVSIIIPTHNSEKFIARSLESALDQTLEEIEIIVVDDGSEDSTRSIIEDFKKADSRIRSLYIKNNVGVGIARNLAIDRALGEFVGFLDSDDYIDPGWYQSLYENSKDKDIVRGIMVHHELDGSIDIRKRKPYGCLIPMIIRKQFLDDNNLRFPKMRKYEDTVFKNALNKIHPRVIMVKNNGNYYHYMKREGSLSNYKRPKVNKNEKREIQNDMKLIYTDTDSKNSINFYSNFSEIIITGSVVVLILSFIFFIWKKIKNLKEFCECIYGKLDCNKEIEIMIENTKVRTNVLQENELI